MGFRPVGRFLPALASTVNIGSDGWTLREGAKTEVLANRVLLAATLDGNGEKLCRASRLTAGTRYKMPEVQGLVS